MHADMKLILSAALFYVGCVAQLLTADVLTTTSTPAKPGLTYLYSANITGSTFYTIGAGPFGTRYAQGIASGIVTGPKFKGVWETPCSEVVGMIADSRLAGTVLPVGGDWGLIDSSGVFRPDVRQTFRTDDGSLIQVFENGVSQIDGNIHVRLTFETGSAKYSWLNTVVGVGILRIIPTGVYIDAWQVSIYPQSLCDKPGRSR
jgi:hypothetical protein